MYMRNTVCLLIGAAAFTAAADPPRREVVEANGLLNQGKTEAALQAYRNLQIDDPESEILYYNIGCAQLESADAPGAPEDSPAAIDSLNAAKTSFDKASMADHPNIRRDARYNRVNCDSRLAKHLAATDDQETAIKAFEDAIYGYEDFLDQYPAHPGAQKNLNHMRYLLKKMLQNPPPEQEQEKEKGEGDENQDGDQQEQQSEDGEKQDQSGEQESDGAPEEQQPGDDPKSEEGTGEDEQQQPGDDPADEGQSSEDSDSGDEPQQPGESQSDANAAPGEEPVELPSKDTIEAILDALQERDKEEQLNMRRVPQNPRRSGPWW